MLLRRIDAYLRSTRTAPTRFGRDVLGDPNFVFNLRDGREPRAATVLRVQRYLEAREPAAQQPERLR
jgi:hypothetical protein